MPLRTVLHALFAILLTGGAASAQAQAPLAMPQAGPIITDFGAVYPVAAPDLAIPDDHTFRLIFDVSVGAASPEAVNPRIETLARFLNMHAQAGVAPDRMQLALVLHGTAGTDALNDAAYAARYAVDNPNRPLLEALAEAGVQIYLCGQTAMHRGLPADALAEPVQMALSAMTVLALYQDRGYELIAF